MAADGAKMQVIWTKLNTADMSIIAEGTLGITVPEEWEFLTTSGILTYRKADNRLFYFYYAKRNKSTANPMRATNAIVYIYDLWAGKVEKGAEVGGEYYFDMMRVIEN